MGRNFETIYKKHIKAVSSKQSSMNNSNYVINICDKVHVFESVSEGLEVLYVCGKSHGLDRLEGRKIYNAKNTISAS